MKRELRTRLAPVTTESKPIVDPWAPMDPHDPDQNRNKAFKKGR